MKEKRRERRIIIEDIVIFFGISVKLIRFCFLGEVLKMEVMVKSFVWLFGVVCFCLVDFVVEVDEWVVILFVGGQLKFSCMSLCVLHLLF